MAEINYKVYVDFDGTIALNDVGDAVLEWFCDGDWQDIVLRWSQRDVSSREVYEQLFSSIHTTEAQMQAFCAEQKIDESFLTFIAFCKNKQLPVTVLSDGLDYYIYHILKRYGLGDLKIVANRMKFVAPNVVEPEFPYSDHQCDFCANCKGDFLRKARQPGDQIIFIGDGTSDQCAVPEADVVFAKDSLLRFCQAENIPHYPIENFEDVLRILRPMIS